MAATQAIPNPMEVNQMMTRNRRWLVYALLSMVFLVGVVGGYATVALLVDAETVSITFRDVLPIAVPVTHATARGSQPNDDAA